MALASIVAARALTARRQIRESAQIIGEISGVSCAILDGPLARDHDFAACVASERLSDFLSAVASMLQKQRKGEHERIKRLDKTAPPR